MMDDEDQPSVSGAAGGQGQRQPQASPAGAPPGCIRRSLPQHSEGEGGRGGGEVSAPTPAGAAVGGGSAPGGERRARAPTGHIPASLFQGAGGSEDDSDEGSPGESPLWGGDVGEVLAGRRASCRKSMVEYSSGDEEDEDDDGGAALRAGGGGPGRSVHGVGVGAGAYPEGEGASAHRGGRGALAGSVPKDFFDDTEDDEVEDGAATRNDQGLSTKAVRFGPRESVEAACPPPGRELHRSQSRVQGRKSTGFVGKSRLEAEEDQDKENEDEDEDGAATRNDQGLSPKAVRFGPRESVEAAGPPPGREFHRFPSTAQGRKPTGFVGKKRLGEPEEGEDDESQSRVQSRKPTGFVGKSHFGEAEEGGDEDEDEAPRGGGQEPAGPRAGSFEGGAGRESDAVPERRGAPPASSAPAVTVVSPDGKGRRMTLKGVQSDDGSSPQRSPRDAGGRGDEHGPTIVAKALGGTLRSGA
ncbi:unnamed protein product [Prorocentrum cordatum]|uniref:Uncharacterized protein n=1 Tax=Prorocentrum cordatum TaxID=2364126 RepID=A0ABN9TAW1_9DINO|nr:unnamed protein product [Polarella glacialis]